jgi:hypothetical protein
VRLRPHDPPTAALSAIETTVLLDMEEAQEAMRKAAGATYRPPGS